jgi:hypothetical protein
VHPIVYQIRRRDALLFGLGVPAVLFPVLFVAARLLSVEFGNVIFGLTILTSFGWIFLNLNQQPNPRKGTDARSILSRRSSRFGDIVPASRHQLLRMAHVLLALTGTVLVGWAYLLAA